MWTELVNVPAVPGGFCTVTSQKDSPSCSSVTSSGTSVAGNHHNAGGTWTPGQHAQEQARCACES